VNTVSPSNTSATLNNYASDSLDRVVKPPDKLVWVVIVFGILIFLGVAYTSPFREQFLSWLYPKPSSEAQTVGQGDINGDGVVDVFDLGIFGGNYGKSGINSTSSTFEQRSDLDSNGTINVFDLGIFASLYGKTYNSSPTVTPTGIITPSIVPGQSDGIWVSPQRIASLPTSGQAWDNVYQAAQGSAGTPDLSNQDDSTNIKVMAKALVFARTGNADMLSGVKSALASIADSGSYNGRALALGRELGAYVIAADLVDLKNQDASLDQRFRNKIRELLTTPTTGGPSNLVDCHEKRGNNWGTMCGGSRAAIAAYLGDNTELERTAQVFKGWLGDRSSYSGFSWGDDCWQCDTSNPVGVNPQGCTKGGNIYDGIMPDDQRRDGCGWPPSCANYVWGGLAGVLVQAQILYQSGYDVWNWENQAIKRTHVWLHSADVKSSNWCAASGDNEWEPHIVNFFYNTSFPAPVPAGPGKNAGWTDWTHAK
jgi:hypothetical protein